MTLSPVSTGSITTRPITVTAVTSSKVYDGSVLSTGVPTITSGGPLVGGDTATWTQTFNNKNVGTGKTLTPAGSVNDGNSGLNYTVTLSPVSTGSITTRPITVTAVTSSKVYDGSVLSTGVPTITSGGPLVGGDTATWTQTFNNKNVGTGKTLTPAGSVNDGNSGLNYTVTLSPVSTGSITTRPITVTAVTSSKVYDGSVLSTGVPTITSGGPLVGGDTATWTQTFDNKNVGTGKTLTPAGSVNDGNSGLNYTVTLTPVSTGSITALPITVTADAKTKVYGTADPALTYTSVPSLIGSDTLPGNLTRTGTENVGVYDIEQGTLNGGTNYSITSFVGATFTITIANQTITVTTHAPASATNGSSFTVAANSSSSLAVAYSSSGVCTNVGPLFTMTSATGTCTVHYNQPGNLNYNPATEVTEIVQATEGPIVTLHPVSVRVLSGNNATFTAAATGNPAPTVKWQYSTDDGDTWDDVPGEISTTLTITAPPLSSNGYQYRAVFTNTAGSSTTNAATLHLLYDRLLLPTVHK